MKDININLKVYIIILLISPLSLFSQEKESYFTFQTEGSLLGQYNSFQANSSELPAYQFVFQAKPQLQVYNFPIRANIRYLSGDGDYSKSMSQFNLSFDINTFKQNLMQKAMGKVNNIKEKGNLSDLSDLESFSKANLQEKAINKLKAKLNSPEALESLQNLKEIENLEAALNNPAFAEKLADFNTLKSKYNIKSKTDIAKYKDKIPASSQEKLVKLYALQERMEQLKAKKEKLMALQAKFEKYRKMADRLRKLENPSIASALKDPKTLKKFLKQNGAFSKAESFLMMVDRVNIGKSNPFYSAYTVNRIALTGFDVAISPGPFYVAALGGKSQFNLFDEQGRLTMYNRQLYGAKVGFGNMNSTHLHVIALQGKDEQGEVLLQDSILVQPQSNILLGADVKLTLFKKKFQLSVEAVGSAHNTSDLAPGVDEEEIYPTETPLFVKDLFAPNFSTHVDVAYKADMKAKLFDNNTDIKATYEHIGPGYASMAAPILLKDRLFYDFRFNQFIFNRQLKFTFFHKQEQDNLVPWKAYKTMANSSGFGLSFYGNKGLMIQANYAPYFQSNDVNTITDTSRITNTNHMFNLTSAYNYKLGDLMGNSQLSFMLINGEMMPNQESIPYSSTSSQNLIFNQTITSPSGLSFNLNTTIIKYENYIEDDNLMSSPDKRNLLMLDLATTFQLFKKWSNSIGVQYANENDLDNKFGFYYRTTVPIYKSIRFNLTAKQNQYKDPVDLTQNYSSFFVNGGIIFKL